MPHSELFRSGIQLIHLYFPIIDIETGNVTSRRSHRNSTKNDEEITSLRNSETNGKGGAVGVKRKADEELTREKAGKNSKFDPSTVPNAETNFSPRRSSQCIQYFIICHSIKIKGTILCFSF
jgi:hypothetical protein